MAKSVLPLWILLGFTSILMLFLGGDDSLYAHMSGTARPSDLPPPLYCHGQCEHLPILKKLHLPIYSWLNALSPSMVVWTGLSAVVTAIRYFMKVKAGIERVNDSIIFTEGAGILLTVAQVVCNAWGVLAGDWATAVLFSWWGMGFVITVFFFLKARAQNRTINWNQSGCPFGPAFLKSIPLKTYTSWACKLAYVVYLLLFVCLGLRWQVFALSAWIVNDNVSKMLLELDSDRLRRTVDDWWIVRVFYLLGLLFPWTFVPGPMTTFCCFLSALLLILWFVGAADLYHRDLLMRYPTNSQLWRNVMYINESGEYVLPPGRKQHAS
mmetsp:Transcript_95199/g.174344  ORF Transcript_95199/g.174344 Transcript_95199/m.174344 type:complete len:324 (-) Transcript_95199:335-1306(-)